MKKILFITHMYVSRVLIATLLTYVYITNSSPSHEGRLERNSPAFFADELESADQADEQEELEANSVELSQE